MKFDWNKNSIIALLKKYYESHKKKLIIFAILSFIGSVYISGLLTQGTLYLSNEIRGISLNPVYMLFYSYANVMYLWKTLFINVLFIIIYLYMHVFVKRKNYDDRNFVQSTSGVHGTSGFMNDFENDMERCLNKDRIDNVYESILGVDLDDEDLVVSVNQKTKFRLNGHKLVAGSSGTKKSRSQSIPDIFQAIRREESYICTDPKGELFATTSHIAEKHGYEVKVLNLKDPLNSDACAFLKFVNGDTLMAQIFADVIIANSGENEKADFWSKSEKALIVFGILAVDLDPSRTQEQKTFYEVYKFLTTKNINQLKAYAKSLKENHPARLAFHTFQEAPENVQNSIVMGLSVRLALLQERKIQEITSHDEIDLVAPGKRKCAYYIITDDQSRALNFVASLFYSFLFKKLVDYADRRERQRVKVPVNFILDEFPNTVKIPDFSLKISTIRSRGLAVSIFVQDLGQLEDLYGGNEFKNIISNCSISILLGTNEHFDGTDYWSKRCGTITVEKETRTSSQNLFTNFLRRQDYKESESEEERALMTRDEIGRLGAERDLALVFIDRERPLKLEKYDYSKHPYNDEIVKINPTKHEPKWWNYFKSDAATDDDIEWFNRQLDILEEQIRLSDDEDEEDSKQVKEKKTEKESSNKKSDTLNRVMNKSEKVLKSAKYFFDKVADKSEENEEKSEEPIILENKSLELFGSSSPVAKGERQTQREIVAETEELIRNETFESEKGLRPKEYTEGIKEEMDLDLKEIPLPVIEDTPLHMNVEERKTESTSKKIVKNQNFNGMKYDSDVEEIDVDLEMDTIEVTNRSQYRQGAESRIPKKKPKKLNQNKI